MSQQKMKAVLQKSPGGPDTLYVGEADIPQVKEGWLLIKSHATALNRADTMQREGKYPPPPGASQIIGLEVAGEVHEVGQGVTKFKKGDRVMALLAGGGYAEYVAVHQGSVMPIPSHMSTVEAAAIPEAWLTAYQILRYIGKIDKDQTALIHAGAGGVGTAAIQIVNVLGAKSIATAGHADKLKFCKELGASAVINYKDKSFVDEIKEWLKTQDKSGIDVIMDPVGGNHFADGIEVIKADGTYVVFAFMGGPNVTLNLQKVMVKRINILGTTLRARTVEYKADLIEHFTKEIIPAFSNGKAKPIIWKTMSVDQIVEAHKAMDNNENTGKIIITFDAAPKQ